MVAPTAAPPVRAFAAMGNEGESTTSGSDGLRVSRFVAALVLLQMAGSYAVNFSLEAPLFGTPGFLIDAANHSSQIALGGIVGLVNEAFFLCIAIAVFPLIAARSRRMALWLIALSAVVLAVAVAETAGVMSMISLSQAYAHATAADRATLQTVRVVVSSWRNWTHFLARILDGTMILSFYIAMFRLALLPRILAAAGIITALLQITALGVTLFGHDPIFPLMAPLGLAQLALVAWLIAKGFQDGRRAAGR